MRQHLSEAGHEDAGKAVRAWAGKTVAAISAQGEAEATVPRKGHP